jgi:hypothetical protein
VTCWQSFAGVKASLFSPFVFAVFIGYLFALDDWLVIVGFVTNRFGEYTSISMSCNVCGKTPKD